MKGGRKGYDGREGEREWRVREEREREREREREAGLQ